MFSFLLESVHDSITKGSRKKCYALWTLLILCVVLKLGHDRFLSHPFQFKSIDYLNIRRHIVLTSSLRKQKKSGSHVYERQVTGVTVQLTC